MFFLLYTLLLNCNDSGNWCNYKFAMFLLLMFRDRKNFCTKNYLLFLINVSTVILYLKTSSVCQIALYIEHPKLEFTTLSRTRGTRLEEIWTHRPPAIWTILSAVFCHTIWIFMLFYIKSFVAGNIPTPLPLTRLSLNFCF